MRKKICVALCVCLLAGVLSGCGAEESNLTGDSNAATFVENNKAEIVDATVEESSEKEANGDGEALVQNQEDAISDTGPRDEDQELSPEDNGLIEIYSGGDSISLSDDMIVGQVTLEDILQGNPFLYNRFKIDGFVFEWIISDDEDEDSIFFANGVLIISKEDDTENTQVIHVSVPYGAPVSLENKFQYMDVNFDSVPDLLICTGHHGNQGAITYCCFLRTDAGFVEAPTFTEIPNPSVDTDNRLILSQWRNWAASHSWAEYKYQDNDYILYRELCEEVEIPENGKDVGEDIWVWTVNGVEIGRSDQLTESEIEDLLYNENSEWRIADDRWRTIYNNGLIRDYSIYGEP